MLEYDPSKVDDEWWKVGKIYYVEWKVQQKNFVWTIYCDREEAEKIRSKEEKNAIWTIMQEKWFKIKDFEEMKKKIEQLEKENEELKSLPPVEVEHVWLDPNGSPYPKFDDPQDENLTKSKEKPVTVWKNKK